MNPLQDLDKTCLENDAIHVKEAMHMSELVFLYMESIQYIRLSCMYA